MLGLRIVGAVAMTGCLACAGTVEAPVADLILTNGRVYSFSWDEPAADGRPADNAPHDASGWLPDASAIAIGGSTVQFVGSDDEAASYRGDHTRVIDLQGATVIPGLVDSHTHVGNLGAALQQVDLVGVETEEEVIERVTERAASVQSGEWIVGYGWDEGAWADSYPDMSLLSERLPDHPVYLRGLHSFAVWGNQLAFERAGIDADTVPPSGGEILRDAQGNPTGILMNRATSLLASAIPPPTLTQRESTMLLGLQAMAASGFTTVHEAGLDQQSVRALENLAADGRLPIRVYVMLSARDEPLMRQWLEWGPDTDGNDKLLTRAVKGFYDGALGSRGARLLDDYSDMPGHRGVSGHEYGFDEGLVTEMIAAGWQVGIHAIGDAGNRETLDFFEAVAAQHPTATTLRHRVEHAQVIHPDDFRRFATLELVASMQPPHAMEDKAWAEQRLGPDRIRGAYAWRTLREAGVDLVFSSDLPGSDHDIFYGLHSAISRRDKKGQPEGGWYQEQRTTAEEALRAYTSWAAYAGFLEETAGEILPGMWADITVMDIDPLNAPPDTLLGGSILYTIVAGEIVFEPPRQ